MPLFLRECKDKFFNDKTKEISAIIPTFFNFFSITPF